MLTMLDPNEIRISILHGRIADDWQVFRGSKGGAIRTIAKTIFFYIISELIFVSAFTAWMQYFHIPTELNINFLLEYAFLFLLAGIVLSCIAVSTAKNSAVVLLPEGWLPLNDIHYNLPRMQKFISYASLTDIQLSYNFLGGPYLVLRYREGKARKWSPSPYFARSARMRILQSILVDYVAYKRSFKECF